MDHLWNCDYPDGESVPLQRTHSARVQKGRDARSEEATDALVEEVVAEAAATS